METFKATVRFTVLSFVLIAGVVSFMGLSPSAKVEAEAIATGAQAENGLASTSKGKVLTAEISSSR